MLFDAASRGRYATDASIYQVMPLGVFVPRTHDDVAAAIDIARDLEVPVLPRGAGTIQCGQTTGAALVIDTSKHLRNVLAFDRDAMTADVEPGIVLDHLNAATEAARALVSGRRVDQRAGHARRHGGQQLLRQPQHRLRQHGAQRARHRRLAGATAALSRSDRVAGLRRARNAASPSSCAALAIEHRAEIDAHWPKVLRRVAGYNLDIFDPQSELPYTRDGSVNLAHLLVGAEGTLAVYALPDAAARPAAPRQGAGRRQLPDLPRGDGRGAAHRQAADRPRWNWSTAR